MGNLMHKPCLYRDEATAWFMRQSKAALADMLTEVMRLESGQCDEPASADACEEKFGSLLESRKRLRGLPKRSANRERFLETGGRNPQKEDE